METLWLEAMLDSRELRGMTRGAAARAICNDVVELVPGNAKGARVLDNPPNSSNGQAQPTTSERKTDKGDK